MKNYLIIVLLSLTSSFAHTQELKKAYFAGGCFWCMEESFDQVDGVISTISGYSGGHLKNPTYQDVICLLYTSPSPRDISGSRMPSSA